MSESTQKLTQGGLITIDNGKYIYVWMMCIQIRYICITCSHWHRHFTPRTWTSQSSHAELQKKEVDRKGRGSAPQQQLPRAHRELQTGQLHEDQIGHEDLKENFAVYLGKKSCSLWCFFLHALRRRWSTKMPSHPVFNNIMMKFKVHQCSIFGQNFQTPPLLSKSGKPLQWATATLLLGQALNMIWSTAVYHITCMRNRVGLKSGRNPTHSVARRHAIQFTRCALISKKSHKNLWNWNHEWLRNNHLYRFLCLSRSWTTFSRKSDCSPPGGSHNGDVSTAQ